MEDLKGKKVLILGGSSGIGFATAKAAANAGGQVTIVSGNQQRIDKALAELPEGSKSFVADLSNEDEVENLFIKIGRFDHLVFTAGEALQLGDIGNLTVNDAKQFFNLRYWGAFTSVKYASQYINEGGSITLTSGCASLRPGKGWSVAASVCAAMEGFTRAMAIELAPVRVNLVMPGVVRTNLWDGMENTEREGMYAHFTDQLPVKYVAQPEDIAQSYLYLMLQKYSTGQRVVVDGGYVLI